MSQHLNDLENLEQELQELKHNFDNFPVVLEDLIQIQHKFVDIAENYQQFQAYIQQAQQILTNIYEKDQKFNSNFQQLKTEIETKWYDLNQEISEVQTETKRVVNQITESEQKFQDKFLELDALKNDLRITLSQLKEAGFNPNNFQRIDKLENQIRNTRSSIGRIDQQATSTRNLVLGTILISVIALIMSTLHFFIKNEPQNQPQTSYIVPRQMSS